MNKSESKYFNTALRMDEALMSLLEKKDFEFITIKEICSLAGVNRSTFYLHYENTRDLLDESIRLMHERFTSYFAVDGADFIRRIGECSEDELFLITPEYLKPYLSFISEHKSIYKAAMENPTNFNSHETYKKMFVHVFDPILEKLNVPKAERQYIMSFYINGITAMVFDWLNDGCRLTIDELISIIIKCIPRNRADKIEYDKNNPQA